MNNRANNDNPCPEQSPTTRPGFLRRHAVAFVISSIIIIAAVLAAILWIFAGHDGNAAWFYIPRNASETAIADSLRSALGQSEGSRVYRLWSMQGGKPATAHGAFRVDPGEPAVKTARRLVHGNQTPVRLTFNNIRTLPQLAERISRSMECPADSFLAAIDSILPAQGYDSPEFIAAFIPDTYEMYWSADPNDIVERLENYRNKFWTEERLAKAAAIGLSPAQVATLASIVQEESAAPDEHPAIARLYLNRLAKGMRLQADPTVKFAIGDFSLRRIRGSHLAFQSPYNTYLHVGLPPGPIRMADPAAIDAVLNAPQHNYLYMCARPDGSGHHDFAADYQTHRANARRYQAWLNSLNIR